MKKAFSIICLLALGTSLLAGCGNNNTEANKSSTEASQNTSNKAETVDPNAKYDPQLNISIDFQVADAMAKDFKEADWPNNLWNQTYRDKYGINLNASWFCKGNDLCSQKKSVAIASANIPDIMTVSIDQLAVLSKTNMIRTDLKEVYDSYASDLTKSVVGEAGAAPWDSATFDGKVLAIPQVDSSIDTASFLWIRQDWLDKLGLKVPTNMEDLYTVMKAFKEQDPDGNGKADTYGLMLNKDFLNPGLAEALGIFNGFHASPDIWVRDSSGKLAFGSVQPEMKDALTYLNKMYKDGLIETDFGAKDSAKASELAASGKVGIEYGAMWNGMYPLQQTKDNFKDSNWMAFALASNDDQPAKPQIKLNVRGYYVVKKDFDHPEALIKMLNLFTEANRGPDKEMYDKFFGPDGPGQHPTAFQEWAAKKNLTAHLNVTEALKSGDTSKLNSEEQGYYDNIKKYQAGDNTQAQFEKVFGETGSFRIMNEYDQNNLFQLDQFYGAPTDTMKSRMDTIKKTEIEYFTKVIMGADSIDNFDKFVSNLNGMGLTQITNEVNEWDAAKK
ncbi:extracellular solute-binding protein [Paenibacillus lupini]|uniref:extracellular solute-binding protein n=1 Tax=Paenibacillus lupini TaxID=1450204 RepID=UPI00141F6755|nr:extracellular solute-binding protein [Paenibacillus lupini]NIK22379.1 putative aldouronate transport system substrate-binding protein [Paenibacillus lupini]